uniref:APC membrane recruitment protein 2 n=1 Tax=Iconisemion striatum TaxID=60296 RepID=A0A1A7WKV7_9TELE
MDVQTENTDPPPNESQPSGKIRKGFKLFGKRKPGNIFSIRSKGDGNNKSPVIGSKASDGSSESHAPNSETDKENGQEVGQGERERAEDETLGEDGVLASAPARTSISSTSSAKSLGFLSLLRGGRRGTGDRRVHTVSQPVGRQRRGLKGLFGNVKFRSKDKEDKEEAPPSPLLMSSRANSVEIIKEDLTLTPKCQPRSLDSPETASCDPDHSTSTTKSAALSPSESSAPKETTGNMAPSPTGETPLVPGDNSLSSLLEDISSLLTFDSISGGDIMADVEAEWGKASSALNAVVSDVTPSSSFSKPTIYSPLTFSTFSSAPTVKASSVAFSSTATTKPESLTTTFTKSSTLTSHSVKVSSDSSPAFYSSTSIQTTTKPSTLPATSTTVSTSVTPSSSKTVPSTSSFISTSTTPANTQSAMNKAPSICPRTAFVSNPNATSVSPAASAKPAVVIQSSLFPVTQPDITSSLEKSTFTSAVESRTPETVTTTSVCTTKPFSPALVTSFKTTTVPTTTPTSGSVSTALSKPPLSLTQLDLNKTPSSFVTISDPGPTSNFTATTKTQPCPASVPAPSLDKIHPVTKPTTSDKMPPPYTAASTHAVSTAIPTAMGQIKILASGRTPAEMQTPASKELAAAAQPKVSPAPAPAQAPVSVFKDPDAFVKTQVSSSKVPPSPTEIPISVSKTPPASVQIPVTITADSRAPISVPVSASKPPPASVQIPITQPKTHPAATTAPCPATSPPSPPAPWSSETSAKMRGAGQASIDLQLVGPDGTGGQGSQVVLPKSKELHTEPHMSLQGLSKEKKPTQSKASGLSKIPVVGGGRVGKLPVRESQHSNDDLSRDPPTPVQEERPNFNSHEAGSKDKISPTETNVPTSKHSQEESQQLQQLKGLTSSGRDSKIPVKHGTQPQTASQTPQSKEPPRTKIPVSKVPVRRAGNKPAATGGIGGQTRK